MAHELFTDEIDETVARMVVAGLPNKAIAARLEMPEGTVKWRLHRMYARMGVQSRTRFVLEVRDHLGGGR
ncbi:MAG TPA: helix-turn-helix transcriptional regulator [Actinomycetota bacterium]|nr:helix-turn-helix transcriptional regulator [Actinomycetota bacterium]